MNIFEKIYDRNKWRFGSGEGSLEKYTRGYVRFLEKFLAEREIGSVLDFGCGDWQFSSRVNWGAVKYHGVDVVKTVIETNQKKYQDDTKKFSLIGEDTDLQPADLFIAKDVFQHWSNEKIVNFLPRLAKFKYALITNCGDLYRCQNAGIENGGFRTLDLSKNPFALKGEYVFSFRTRPATVKNLVKWFLPYQC